MFINNITNLLTYYTPNVHAHRHFEQVSTGTIEDITALNFVVGNYQYSITIDSDSIEYYISSKDICDGHIYHSCLKIDDPLIHAKLYTLYLECRQKAWDNFLKDTEVPIPSSAADGFAKLMD